jgi:hypothetical protein
MGAAPQMDESESRYDDRSRCGTRGVRRASSGGDIRLATPGATLPADRRDDAPGDHRHSLATDIISTTPTTVTWAIGEQRFYLEEAFAMQQQVLDDLDAAPEVEPGDERDESAENFVRMVVGWMDFNISSGPEMEAIVLMNRLERLRQTGRVTLLPDGWDSLWSDPRTDSVRLAQQRAERTPTPLPTD